MAPSWKSTGCESGRKALGGKYTVKIVPGEGHKVDPSFFACPELVAFLLNDCK
jgi:hypothetical protein